MTTYFFHDLTGYDILEKYEPAGIDETGAIKYYGFIDKDANWYIMKLTTSGATFCKGCYDYAANWILRADLSYDVFDVIF